MRNKKTEEKDRVTARRERQKHFGLTRDERKVWHEHMKESIRDGSESIAIYLDGMDQNKTDIPRVDHEDSIEKGSLLRVRYDFCFFFCDSFRLDSSVGYSTLVVLFALTLSFSLHDSMAIQTPTLNAFAEFSND
jgi:hypothetical protein